MKTGHPYLVLIGLVLLFALFVLGCGINIREISINIKEINIDTNLFSTSTPIADVTETVATTKKDEILEAKIITNTNTPIATVNKELITPKIFTTTVTPTVKTIKEYKFETIPDYNTVTQEISWKGTCEDVKVIEVVNSNTGYTIDSQNPKLKNDSCWIKSNLNAGKYYLHIFETKIRSESFYVPEKNKKNKEQTVVPQRTPIPTVIPTAIPTSNLPPRPDGTPITN